MEVRFYDRQDESNPHNGQLISGKEAIRSVVLEHLRDRPPFFFELEADSGSRLLVGVGPQCGCAQYTALEGVPPYRMALGDCCGDKQFLEFLIADTLTPVPSRYSLSLAELLNLIEEFVETASAYPGVEWEEI